VTTATRPDAPPSATHPPRHPVGVFVGGFFMGSADVVPGVSGGTIALVLGIYERLVAEVHHGASVLKDLLRGDLRGAWARFRSIGWSFMLPLLGGIVTAVLVLASTLEHLLEEQPVALSAVFFGLVVGSVVVAVTELRRPAPSQAVLGLAVAVVTFFLLGLRPAAPSDPALWAVFGAGAIAICAMILPGISGSFILLLLGLYEFVIGVVSNRDVVTAGVFVAGAVLGLALFSTLLNWLLEHHHDAVLAALIGLMAGSLRVLWPWPAGPDGVGDTRLGAPEPTELWSALGLAFLGLVVVAGIAVLGRLSKPGDDA
jgi:putative membrane protein